MPDSTKPASLKVKFAEGKFILCNFTRLLNIYIYIYTSIHVKNNV